MAANYKRERLNNKLFQLHGRNGNSKLRILASKYDQQDAGFTMLEMIVVVIMIGILAAIAAPGWLGFVNRQRVNKANDAVLSALQQAQREAKKSKINYNVSFRINDEDEDVSEFAVYPSSGSPLWQTLGEGKIALLTNLVDTNKTDTDGALDLNYLDAEKTITFDYIGSLPDAEFGGEDEDEETPGLKIAVVIRNDGTTASADDMKRCVIVKTLLGSMITERDDKCN